MKIDRLLGIIMILLQQDKITAPQLAERFEVSKRTINRDIEDICKAGIPLVTAQGHNGGISILDSYKVDKTFFTQEELQAILTGLKGVDSVSKVSYLANLVEKLSSSNNRIITDNTIIIDLASHYQEPLTQKIAEIKKAILLKHVITFCYYSEKGESQRRIEPYHLVFKWSSWYVFGYCLDKNTYRLFKLNRLEALHTSEEVFAAREIPESELHWNDYFSSNAIHLKALFDADERYRLIEEYGLDCYTTSKDGKLFFERDFASYKNMQEWVFSFGDKVIVLEPEELLIDWINQAKNIIKHKNMLKNETKIK